MQVPINDTMGQKGRAEPGARALCILGGRRFWQVGSQWDRFRCAIHYLFDPLSYEPLRNVVIVGSVVSFDVESLLTNIPLEESIDLGVKYGLSQRATIILNLTSRASRNYLK